MQRSTQPAESYRPRYYLVGPERLTHLYSQAIRPLDWSGAHGPHGYFGRVTAAEVLVWGEWQGDAVQAVGAGPQPAGIAGSATTADFSGQPEEAAVDPHYLRNRVSRFSRKARRPSVASSLVWVSAVASDSVNRPSLIDMS